MKICIEKNLLVKETFFQNVLYLIKRLQIAFYKIIKLLSRYIVFIIELTFLIINERKQFIIKGKPEVSDNFN